MLFYIISRNSGFYGSSDVCNSLHYFRKCYLLPWLIKDILPLPINLSGCSKGSFSTQSWSLNPKKMHVSSTSKVKKILWKVLWIMHFGAPFCLLFFSLALQRVQLFWRWCTLSKGAVWNIVKPRFLFKTVDLWSYILPSDRYSHTPKKKWEGPLSGNPVRGCLGDTPFGGSL